VTSSDPRDVGRGGGGRWCEEVHDESSTDYRVVILIDFMKKATE
jgi:hypothetical protein